MPRPDVGKDGERQVEDLCERCEDEREGDAAGGALREVVPRCMRNGGGEEQYRRSLIAERMNWVSIEEPGGPIGAVARIRSTHEGADVMVEPLPDRCARITFRDPQRAITPGQAVVLHRDDLVLGGGFIRAAL